MELGSDQTSLHNPYAGGYYPAGLSFEDANELMRTDPDGFKERVHESLRRQVAAINAMAARGMHFWDYGNAFLFEAKTAGAPVAREDGGFRYPSYVEDIMGPMCFDHGFGPFRWVCTSGDAKDLAHDRRDRGRRAREDGRRRSRRDPPAAPRQPALDPAGGGERRSWWAQQARILYADAEGRTRIALAFNEAIREGRISAPVVLGRDHHDVSGTDSPYRETADIRDGEPALRGHGGAQRHRRRFPRRDVGEPPQRRRRRLGRGDQRRIRHGARRQRRRRTAASARCSTGT